MDEIFGDLLTVFAGDDNIALARDDIAETEDIVMGIELSQVPVFPGIKLALHGNPLNGLGDAPDRTDRQGGSHRKFCIWEFYDPVVLNLRLDKSQPHQTPIFDDLVEGQ